MCDNISTYGVRIWNPGPSKRPIVAPPCSWVKHLTSRELKVKDQIKHLCSAANSVTSPKSPEVQMNFYVKDFLPQLKSNIFCNISKERPGSHSPQSLQLPLSRMINPENTDWDVCAGLSILFIRIGILCQRDKPIITPWVEDHLPITVEGQIQLPPSNPKHLWRKLYFDLVFTSTCAEELLFQMVSKKR